MESENLFTKLLTELLEFVSNPGFIILVVLTVFLINVFRNGAKRRNATPEQAPAPDFIETIGADMLGAVRGFSEASRGFAQAASYHTQLGTAMQGFGNVDLTQLRGDYLSRSSWLNLLNNQPDRIPHLIVLGPSGAGKTELVRALLTNRDGEAIVLTPKPNDIPRWYPLPVISIDSDASYNTIANALKALLRVSLDRNVADLRMAQHGQSANHKPLTIVIDDAGIFGIDKTTSEPLRDLVIRVGRIGRSIRVRLILLSDVSNAQSLGVIGEKRSIDANYLALNMTRDRVVTLSLDDKTLFLNTQGLSMLAREPVLSEPFTSFTEPRTNERTNERTKPESPIDSGSFVRSLEAGDREGLIRLLVDAGWSVTDIRAVVKGEAAQIGETVRKIQDEPKP